MGFNAKIYTAALAQKNYLQKYAEAEAEAKKQKVYAKNPKLQELDYSISSAGTGIAIAAISGASVSDIMKRIEALTFEKTAILNELGYTASDFETKYNCPLCGDSGYNDGHLCICVKELAKKLVCENLSTEMPLVNSTFENFDLSFYPDNVDDNKVVPRKRMSQIYKFCKDYAADFSKESPNLLFIGNTGLGKTHLSLAIAGEVIAKSYGVIYGPSVKLISRVEKEHFSGSGSDYLEGLLSCDLLIIDDLGTEFISPFTVSVVNNIINSRILSSLPTIISTNFTLKELGEKYTPRVTSRFIGSYTQKAFAGMDIRQEKQLRARGK